MRPCSMRYKHLHDLRQFLAHVLCYLATPHVTLQVLWTRLPLLNDSPRGVHAQSFNVGVAGDRLVLPTTCLEQWFAKFDAKFKRDPDFLLSNLGDG